MAKDKKTSDYISIKESRAIIKDNIKKMKYYEGLKKKNLPVEEYTSYMKDENNIIEIDGLKTCFFTDNGTVMSVNGVSFNIPKNKKIAEFSSGMKVKLKILVAITHKARLLILDEPTTGLDVEARNEVLDMLRQYVSFDDTRSILITSHISSDLENLCDDIYLIHNGRIILHEDTDAIVEQYGVLKVNEEQFKELDKSYILNSLKENYGYACFVKSKAFYKENYPGIVVENGGIDELILMMTGGYK